jgi:hypothetical protein
MRVALIRDQMAGEAQNIAGFSFLFGPHFGLVAQW